MAGSWVGEYKVRVERPERPRRCKYCIRTALTHTLISGPGVSVSIFTCRDHYRLLTVEFLVLRAGAVQVVTATVEKAVEAADNPKLIHIAHKFPTGKVTEDMVVKVTRSGG
jgi:hypothetical protein